VFPAVSVTQGTSVKFNLGREPFVMPLPEGYLPIEDPQRAASSWLARFEHAGDVTETVYSRQPLPPAYVELAFASEDASADAKPIPVTVHSKSGSFHHPNVGSLLAEDNCNPVPLTQGGTLTLVIAGGANSEPAFLHSVTLKGAAASGSVEGLVFASVTRPDVESLSWTDGFSEPMFKAFIARQGTSRDRLVPSAVSGLATSGGAGGAASDMVALWEPEPFEPVAFFRISSTNVNSVAKLPRPCRAKFITIKLLNPSSFSQAGLSQVHVSGLPGAHPLGSILGTPKFSETVANVVQQVWWIVCACGFVWSVCCGC
jgi:hypothetical protein